MKMKTNTAKQLKMRGYSVNETPGGMLVEKSTFWGYFQYDSSISTNTSRYYWPRSIVLGILSYGMIFLASGLWWLHKKGVLQQEVLALTQGE